METNFFDELKQFVINEHRESKYFAKYIQYYETLLQNKEILEPLIKDYEEWSIEIHHFKLNENSYGKYIIDLYKDENNSSNDINAYYPEWTNYHYEIELTRSERYWGYCECDPSMDGYNPKYKCCGDGCDWVAPAFEFKKVYTYEGSFKGKERDIWELQEKWDEYLGSYNKMIQENKLKRIDEQLNRLLKEKEDLLGE